MVAFTVAGIRTYIVGGLKGSRDLAIGGNTLAVGGNGQSTTYAGSLSGAGALTKAGAGTLTLAGSNSYRGGTTISGGVLTIGAGGTTGSIAGNVVNNAALFFNRSDASTYSGIISGAGAVTKQGVGTLTLAGPNSYSGPTTISGGVLALSGTGSIGTGGLNLGTDGIFDLAALASGTYALVTIGAGILGLTRWRKRRTAERMV